jgi:hypothetical protein
LPPLRQPQRAGDPEAAASERYAADYAARASFCSCRPFRKSAARCAWLAALKTARLRAARVALITPLRDDMNLVAKEFVASQNPDDPGVLILSRFAGAAEECKAAYFWLGQRDQPVS